MQEFLVSETAATDDGEGAEVALGGNCGKPLLLTLGITRIIEQESLDISTWGSADQERWRQLTTYPQKFYCGTYLLMLDLSRHPEVHHLRAQWRIRRWDAGERAALADFYLYLSAGVARAQAVAAA